MKVNRTPAFKELCISVLCDVLCLINGRGLLVAEMHIGKQLQECVASAVDCNLLKDIFHTVGITKVLW